MFSNRQTTKKALHKIRDSVFSRGSDPGAITPVQSTKGQYDPYAPYYDTAFPLDPIENTFWENLAAAADGPVVEIGSGNGRITRALARATRQTVIGIEPSQGMLAEARKREHTSNLSYMPGEFESVSCEDASVALILSPRGAFSHVLTYESRVRSVREMQRIARPEAYFVIDIPHFALDHPLMSGKTFKTTSVRKVLPDGQKITVATTFRVDSDARINRTNHVLQVDGREVPVSLNTAIITYDEVRAYLELGGFAVRETFGGYNREAFTEHSDRLIVVAQAPE